MRRIVIRLEASPRVGYGHLRRGMILAEAFRRSGDDVSFVCSEGSDAVERLRAARWCVDEFITAGDSMEGIVGETAERVDEIQAIFSRSARLAVLDVQNTDHATVAALKEAGMLVLTFDDLGDGRYLADIVVDANLTEKTNPRKMETPTRYLLGPRYAVLDPKVRRLGDLFRSTRKRIKRIVVACGGTDPAGATGLAVEGLGTLDPEIRVDVVLGGGFASVHKLDAALKSAVREFVIHQDVPNLPDFLRRADLGIISGGITLFEAAAVGLPCLVVAQNKHQLVNVQAFEEAGGVRSMGLAANVAPEEIHHAVKELFPRAKRSAMRRTMMSLVDGKGLARVMGEIKRVLL